MRATKTRCLRHRLEKGAADLEHTLARLRALSPAATLQRGYAIVARRDGVVVRQPDQVRPGDPVRLRLAGGELPATVGAS